MGLLPTGWRAEGSVRHDGVDLVEQVGPRLVRTAWPDLVDGFPGPVLRTGFRFDGLASRSVASSGGTRRRTGARSRSGRSTSSARWPCPALDQIVRSYPHELSGGQRQRIMIAMALACYPQMIIADEPTTALDVTVQKQVLRLLDSAVRERGCALLMITHDLPIIAAVCDVVAVMYAGRIVEMGPVAEVFRSPRHHYTKGAARLAADHGQHRLGRCCATAIDFGHGARLARAAERMFLSSALSGSGRDLPDRGAATRFRSSYGRLRASPVAGFMTRPGLRPILEARQITKTYRLRRRTLFSPRPSLTVLQSVDLDVCAGEAVGLVGRIRVGQDDAHADLDWHAIAGTLVMCCTKGSISGRARSTAARISGARCRS